MFHPQSEISENPPRGPKVDCLNEIDFSTFDTITNKIIDGYDVCLVTSMKLNPIDVTMKKQTPLLVEWPSPLANASRERLS